jgi:Amt family ammonium transporter
MIIGILTSTCSYICVEHIVKDRIDDSIDVFGIHGIGGITGALLTGVFASVAVNPDGMNGLMYGNPSALLIQFLSVVLTILYAGIVSFILLKIIKLFLGLRVTVMEENKGLDVSIHDEIGYNKH